MRKQLITKASDADTRHPSPDGQWLDLDELAEAEISSEDAASPIEAALLPSGNQGWRAAGPGEQIVRLRFATPQSISRVHLEFADECAERTQEFVLRWRPSGGGGIRELVRQQFTFSPAGATREIEDYTVNLREVSELELSITPDIRGGNAVASLKKLAVSR
jgi:hypothetical protein